MSAFFFTVKTIVFTVLVIGVLQIRWDGETMEERIIGAAEATGVLNLADTVAQGAVKLATNTWRRFGMGPGSSEPQPLTSADLGFNQGEYYMATKSESARKAIEKFRKTFKERQSNSEIKETDLADEVD